MEQFLGTRHCGESFCQRDLDWPWDLLGPTEYSGNDAMPVPSLWVSAALRAPRLLPGEQAELTC